MEKSCILEEKPCTGCGECQLCDLDPAKKCDNCMKCIQGDTDTFRKVDLGTVRFLTGKKPKTND